MNTPADPAPAPLGEYIDHHRHLGTEHFLNDRARGIEQASRRVQLNDQRFRSVRFRSPDAFADKIVHRGIDAAVDRNHVDMGRRRIFRLGQ